MELHATLLLEGAQLSNLTHKPKLNYSKLKQIDFIFKHVSHSEDITWGVGKYPRSAAFWSDTSLPRNFR